MMAAQTWSVDELCAGVGLALADAFPDELWVRGEIQGLRRSPAGHLYFDLIEPGARGRGTDAKLSIVAFRGALRGIEAVLRKVGGLVLDDGLEVRIRGRLDYYPPQGRVQFMMNAIDPRHTLGQLAADKDAVLRALAEAGLVDRNRQRLLAPVPLRVGLVTSEGSAAHHDFVGELAMCGFAFEVVLAHTRVQGVGAEELISAAIRLVDAFGVDAIAVVRGGGARSDLVAFDQHDVALAIAEASVPVFVGVGHEIDRSVADEVAFASLKTPTACAGALISRVSEFVQLLDRRASAVSQLATRNLVRSDQRLAAHRSRIGRATGHAMNLAEHRNNTTAERVAASAKRTLQSAHDRAERAAAAVTSASNFQIRRADEHLDRQQVALSRLARRPITNAEQHLDAAARMVRAVHPKRTLELGYSITRGADGRAISSIDQLQTGDAITTEVVDGAVTSTVTGTEAHLHTPTGDS
jgi:exodeoxyribonuclease VII large subunit